LQFEAQAQNRLESIQPEERQDWVRRLMGFVDIEPRLAAIADHPDLLRAMNILLKDTPVLLQDMALLKPPHIGREKPWHQDNAFFDIDHQATVIGVWIALDQAIPENGCMHIIPGSHLAGPKIHFQRRDFQICDTDVAVQEVTAVPLEPGGALLFHSLLHHGTPPSQSNKRRRAVQYHYRPSQAQMVNREARLAVFGSKGKDAQC
jgi:phytanoyl-CoA hydroxylase